MEKFSNQNLKEVKFILKNGNVFSITKNSNLTYDKLNIVTGSSEYRALFLRSLISSIDGENKNEISILTNIDNLQTTRVKTTRILEKDIDKVVMNICDDIFAVSRFRVQWVDRPNLVYVIDIPDNNYNKDKYIEKLNKVISTASQLNIMIILGMLSCIQLSYANMLNIGNNQLGDSFINGDEFKVIDNKLFVDFADKIEEPITFETYGYRKVVDDEFRVVYARPLETTGENVITITKKAYRYAKYYIDKNGNQAYTYIYEYEDRLIHEELNKFAKYRVVEENKIANLINKKKIKLTQETIDKTDKTLENVAGGIVMSDKPGYMDKKIYAVYCQNKKTDKKTYVAELQEDKTILFSDKPTGFDARTIIYLTNELMNHYNIVGKEELK